MINKESTKAGVIVMAMILAMFALAGILAKGCERIDATWEEQYPTEVREVAARGVREIRLNFIGNIQNHKLLYV